MVLILLPGSAMAGGADTEREAPRLEATVKAMGTTFKLILYGKDNNQLQSAFEQSSAEIRRLDRMLSFYNPSSEWSLVNRLAASRRVRISPELFDLLSGCLEYSRVSEGAFDISVGALMKAWGFHRGSGRLPHPAEVKHALARSGYENMWLDANDKAVRFLKNGLELDSGGIGKGYAVDRVMAVFKRNGIISALVSAGSSSIYAMGVPPTEPRGWRATIRDPRDTSKTVAEVYLRDESLSTTGNYENYFYADGKRFSHVMDPRTGYPAQGMLSVSVIAPRTLDSEAWTKPYFILGREWAAGHKPRQFRIFLCEERLESSSNCCGWLL